MNFADFLPPRLFRCPACGGTPDRARFPLCALCAEALAPCPLLCVLCGDLACRGACAQTLPWSPTALRSLSARYLAVGPGYEVLKAWKRRRGPIFNHQVLKMDLDAVKRLLRPLGKNRISCVTPVPQAAARAWALGGSPARVVARWVADGLDLPVVPLLDLVPAQAAASDSSSTERPRQAELDRFDRHARGHRFRARADLPQDLDGVLIVDDLLTTGATLRAAADTLRRAGVPNLHGFVLGYRPITGAMTGAAREAATPAEPVEPNPTRSPEPAPAHPPAP